MIQTEYKINLTSTTCSYIIYKSCFIENAQWILFYFTRVNFMSLNEDMVHLHYTNIFKNHFNINNMFIYDVQVMFWFENVSRISLIFAGINFMRLKENTVDIHDRDI
jgi:hypothetical protein